VLERFDPPVETPPETFEDFYLREYIAVVGLAYALSGSRWGAEDLAQEAFLAAHRDWARISTYDRPGAWVRRVVANLSVSGFRRRVAEAKALARSPSGSPQPFRTWPPATPSSGRRSELSPDARPRWWRSTTWRTARSPRSRGSST
jgi:DNA-directed RNA polymerase specialized sigma24 family protein